MRQFTHTSPSTHSPDGEVDEVVGPDCAAPDPPDPEDVPVPEPEPVVEDDPDPEEVPEPVDAVGVVDVRLAEPVDAEPVPEPDAPPADGAATEDAEPEEAECVTVCVVVGAVGRGVAAESGCTSGAEAPCVAGAECRCAVPAVGDDEDDEDGDDAWSPVCGDVVSRCCCGSEAPVFAASGVAAAWVLVPDSRCIEATVRPPPTRATAVATRARRWVFFQRASRRRRAARPSRAGATPTTFASAGPAGAASAVRSRGASAAPAGAPAAAVGAVASSGDRAARGAAGAPAAGSPGSRPALRHVPEDVTCQPAFIRAAGPGVACGAGAGAPAPEGRAEGMWGAMSGA
nr:hypothetical protein [Streptomyces tropicalis]